MRAMQHTKFRAKNAKNDLKPTDFLKRNFYFETEGVFARLDEQCWINISVGDTTLQYTISIEQDN